MYHPMIQQALADSHRADLLAVARRERLARESRTQRRGGTVTSLDDGLTLINRLRHRPALAAAASAMAAAAILVAGEL